MKTRLIISVFLAVNFCYAIASENSTLNCDFESETFCQWKRGEDNLKWIITNDSHVHGGPLNADRHGYFLTTVGRSLVGGTASLISPPVNKGMHCLHLSVKSPIRESSQFTIYKVVGPMRVPLYRSRGAQFYDWQDITTLIASPIPVKIKIESEQTDGEIGLIFIDDIRIRPGKCPLKPLTYVNVTCDFEDAERMCGFTPDDNGTDKWILATHRAIRKGPSRLRKFPDHTMMTTSGSYLISQMVGNKSEGSTSVTRSPLYNGTGVTCMTFFYAMFRATHGRTTAKNIGKLNLYVVPVGEQPDKLGPWLQGSWTHGDEMNWEKVDLEFTMTTQYQVVLESIAQDTHVLYTFDDLKIWQCPPPTTTTVATTTTTTSTTTPTTTTTTTPTTSTPTTSTTTTTTPSTTTTSTASIKVEQPQQQKQVPENTWYIAAGAGSGVLLIIVIIIVLFIVKTRQANTENKKEKFDTDFEDMSIAFNNPIFPEMNKISLKMQGEDNA